MEPQATRRYAILAEGQFGQVGAKTATGVIRYGREPVVAVLDSTRPNGNVRDVLGDGFDIPIVATLQEALPYRPTALLIGIAPAGGRIPAQWRSTILGAIDAGMDVVSGLHEFVSDDPEFAAAADARGVALVDHRRPPDRYEVTTGRSHAPGKRVVLTVGTDCAIGKMSVALELRRAAREAGLSSAFVPTGQTGIMIEGWGVAIDRVIADFVQGTAEWLVERGESMGDWVFVEGQGSLDHPAYSSVTLGLIHGTTPHAMVMVHQPGRADHHGWEGRDRSGVKPLGPFIELHERIAGLISPSHVTAVALFTAGMDDSAARRAIARVEAETGLLADDPVRYGGERILDALRSRLGD